jgi:hypothetical protein
MGIDTWGARKLFTGLSNYLYKIQRRCLGSPNKLWRESSNRGDVNRRSWAHNCPYNSQLFTIVPLATDGLTYKSDIHDRS